MAEVHAEFDRQGDAVQTGIRLSLSMIEAEFLMFVMDRVRGNGATSPAWLAYDIKNAIEANGVERTVFSVETLESGQDILKFRKPPPGGIA